MLESWLATRVGEPTVSGVTGTSETGTSSDASQDDQNKLADETVDVLARIHAVPEPEARFDLLAFDDARPTPLRRHIAHTRACDGKQGWGCSSMGPWAGTIPRASPIGRRSQTRGG